MSTVMRPKKTAQEIAEAQTAATEAASAAQEAASAAQQATEVAQAAAQQAAEVAQESLANETHDIEKQEIQESEPSNGLENFGLQEEGSFELFDNTDETQSTLEQENKDEEEDELEIPAFLRRQKN